MQLQFQRPAALLRPPLSRELIVAASVTAIEFVLIAVLAWQVAKLGWAVLTPAPPLGNWQPATHAPASIDRTSIFSFDPFFRTAADENAAVSSLDLVISGIRVDTVSGRGSAIIATSGGAQASYAVGDTIQPGVILKSVDFDSVTIDRSGTPEKLFIDQSAGETPLATAADAAINGQTTGTRLAADVTVTPRLQGNNLTGYILTPKGSGAAFAAAGLEPGDVLVSVDGATVASLKDVAGISQQLDAGGIEISVERAGRPISIRIGKK